MYICTWLYADSPDEQIRHYQVPGYSSSDEFQWIYWRCVVVFFATSFRQQPAARHVLFTNVSSLPTVDGISIASLLDSLDVEIVHLALTFGTPPGYYHRWRNQFYVFDIVHYLAKRLGPSDSAVVLDSDCVWVTSGEAMHEALQRDGALTYAVTYDPHWDNNGFSRIEMSELASALLERQVRHPLVYCGGELQAASGSEFRRLAQEISEVWQQLMDRYAKRETVFFEEGQTLSYIYYKLGYSIGNANPFVRRIFTGSLGVENNATDHDHGLVVWHLPLEKRLGIRRLFADVSRETSAFWKVDPGVELRRYLGSYLGVPKSSFRKRIRDLFRRVMDKTRR